MTSKELDERIEAVYNSAQGLEGLNASVKQLIRDCIEAVTPKREPDYGVLTGKKTSQFNKAIDTIEANTRGLLG